MPLKFTERDNAILTEIRRCGFVNLIEGEGGTESGLRITAYRLGRLRGQGLIAPGNDQLLPGAEPQTYVPTKLFQKESKA